MVRFARSLFKGRERDRARSLALIEATLVTITDVADENLRRELLSDLLNRTYENLVNL